MSTLFSSQIGLYYPRRSITWDWRVIAVSGALLIMSFLLATGREWARRSLLVVVIFVGAYFLLLYGTHAVGPISFGHVRAEDLPTERLSHHLEGFSSFFLALGVVAFAVLFLCHPDIVSSFRRNDRRTEKV